MMTVADFMATGTDTPLYIQTPFGLCRVVGVVARRPLPEIVCVTGSGEHLVFYTLWTTELASCPDCLDCGEMEASDMPGMTALCPCQKDEVEIQQYP